MHRIEITVIGFLVFVLFSGCMTTGQSKLSAELYSIQETETEALEGNYTTRELLLYKDAAVGDSMTISLMTGTAEDFPPMFVLRLDRSDWLFPEYLGVAANGAIVRLEDVKEETEVISGTWVSEVYWYQIPEDTLSEFIQLDSLRFEIPGKGVMEIPEEGLQAVEDFMRE